MDLIDRDALEPFYESGTDPKDPYADMTFIRAEHIMNAPAVNRWIACSEELPASICRVLVTTFAGNVGIAVFNPEKKRWYKNGEFYDLRLIIAWMPMPNAYEPPESEVQE